MSALLLFSTVTITLVLIFYSIGVCANVFRVLKNLAHFNDIMAFQVFEYFIRK